MARKNRTEADKRGQRNIKRDRNRMKSCLRADLLRREYSEHMVLKTIDHGSNEGAGRASVTDGVSLAAASGVAGFRGSVVSPVSC